MSDRSIIEAIVKMCGLHKVDNVVYADASVDSVDLPTRSCACTVIAGHTEYKLPTVKLMASVDDGFLIEPELNSTVKVIFSVNVEPFVVQFSEIKNITIFANTKIQFQDGTFGGLVKAGELKTQLTNLKNTVTGIITALTAMQATSFVDAGASWTTAKATIPNISNFDSLENLTVTHGTN